MAGPVSLSLGPSYRTRTFPNTPEIPPKIPYSKILTPCEPPRDLAPGPSSHISHNPVLVPVLQAHWSNSISRKTRSFPPERLTLSCLLRMPHPSSLSFESQVQCSCLIQALPNHQSPMPGHCSWFGHMTGSSPLAFSSGVLRYLLLTSVLSAPAPLSGELQESGQWICFVDHCISNAYQSAWHAVGS